jgi:hypothetical protein
MAVLMLIVSMRVFRRLTGAAGLRRNSLVHAAIVAFLQALRAGSSGAGNRPVGNLGHRKTCIQPTDCGRSGKRRWHSLPRCAKTVKLDNDRKIPAYVQNKECEREDAHAVAVVHALQLLPHAQTLRVPPAIEAGLTDHVWESEELLWTTLKVVPI